MPGQPVDSTIDGGLCRRTGLGGSFSLTPAYGYPPGTPDGAPDEVRWHGILHGIAPAAAELALIAACFVFAPRFAAGNERGWAAVCVTVAAVNIVATTTTFATEDYRYMWPVGRSRRPGASPRGAVYGDTSGHARDTQS
jgi:hypothetical protein